MDYYRHFPGDYLRDTLTLTLAEDGVYRRLLDYQYTIERPIRDLKEACLGARIGSKTGRKTVQKVLSLFFNRTEAGYVNPRFEKELTYTESKRKKAKESAETRWKKDATVLRRQSEGNAIPDNQTTRQPEQTHTPIEARVFETPNFKRFMEAYPIQTDRTDANREWFRKGIDGQVELVLAGLAAWKASDRWEELRYVPGPAKFLRDRRWEVLPPTGKLKKPGPSLEERRRELEGKYADVTRRPA